VAHPVAYLGTHQVPSPSHHPSPSKQRPHPHARAPAVFETEAGSDGGGGDGARAVGLTRIGVCAADVASGHILLGEFIDDEVRALCGGRACFEACVFWGGGDTIRREGILVAVLPPRAQRRQGGKAHGSIPIRAHLVALFPVAAAAAIWALHATPPTD